MTTGGDHVTILGLILILLDVLVLHTGVLFWIGLVLALCGLLFVGLAHSGRGRYWY